MAIRLSPLTNGDRDARGRLEWIEKWEHHDVRETRLGSGFGNARPCKPRFCAAVQFIQQQHDHQFGMWRPIVAGSHGKVPYRSQKVTGRNIATGSAPTFH